ncbi:hypothetical protein C8R42DRAFT_640983 [Lentinula raphanica]|nr:hypothetical protein C8R42DRAFT_640983 [Lentinula raphanica]
MRVYILAMLCYWAYLFVALETVAFAVAAVIPTSSSSKPSQTAVVSSPATEERNKNLYPRFYVFLTYHRGEDASIEEFETVEKERYHAADQRVRHFLSFAARDLGMSDLVVGEPAVGHPAPDKHGNVNFTIFLETLLDDRSGKEHQSAFNGTVNIQTPRINGELSRPESGMVVVRVIDDVVQKIESTGNQKGNHVKFQKGEKLAQIKTYILDDKPKDLVKPPIQKLKMYSSDDDTPNRLKKTRPSGLRRTLSMPSLFGT